MNNKTSLPTDLQSVIGTENIDFSVFARRNQPINKSIGVLALGTIWTAFTSIPVIVFFGPLFKGEECILKQMVFPRLAVGIISTNNCTSFNYWNVCINWYHTINQGILFLFLKRRVFCRHKK